MRNTEFEDYDAVAIGYDGRKVLYEDFTEGYIPYTPEIEDTLLYPATYGQHNGHADVIPENLKNFRLNGKLSDGLDDKDEKFSFKIYNIGLKNGH